jgi:beta-glucosidase
VTTILGGIRETVGEAGDVQHAPGCWVTDRVPRDVEDAEFAATGDGARHFEGNQEYRIDQRLEEAVRLARDSDVAVLVLGQILRASGEASYCHTFDLPVHQGRLLQAVVATGTPTVLVIVGPRVMSVRWARGHVPAILQAWEPGTEGGRAVADILFGDYNPCGKLPITAALYSSKEPVYYNYKRTGRPGQRYFDYLYPFGYGLSYTTFKYDAVTLSSTSISCEETLTVSLKVTNSGSRAGAEVVQLYLRDEQASMTRPVKMLRGFERVELDAGESRTVTFELAPEDLGFHDNDSNIRIERGRFTLWVGPNSEEGNEAHFELV